MLDKHLLCSLYTILKLDTSVIFFLFYFACMDILPACMCVCMYNPWRTEEGTESSGTGDRIKSPCGLCRESNPSLRKEQPMLLMPESSISLALLSYSYTFTFILVNSCVYGCKQSTLGVIPQVLSKLFCEAESVTGLKLTK